MILDLSDLETSQIRSHFILTLFLDIGPEVLPVSTENWRTKIKTLKYSCCHNEKKNENISNRWLSFHTSAFSFVLFSKYERPALFPVLLVDGYIA